MQTINWGIIGCGDVTEKKSGPAFGKVPHSRLVAVMRRDAAKAADYARRHGVSKWHSDAGALIDDPEVNAVYIATPPRYHAAYAIEALKKNKPVYLEKPMTMNAAEAEEICAVSRQTGTMISIAHYRRQQPLFKKILSLLQEGHIGAVQWVNLQYFQPNRIQVAPSESNWRVDPAISGGGLFHDLAPHQLDLLIYFFGAWKKAFGLSSNRGSLYAADDTVCGQALFENGVLFHGAWSFAMDEQTDRVEIIGTKGKISFSVFAQAPLAVQRGNEVEEIDFDPLMHVQQPMIESVVAYFLGRSPNPCTAEEGLQVMQLLDAFTKKQ